MAGDRITTFWMLSIEVYGSKVYDEVIRVELNWTLRRWASEDSRVSHNWSVSHNWYLYPTSQPNFRKISRKTRFREEKQILDSVFLGIRNRRLRHFFLSLLQFQLCGERCLKPSDPWVPDANLSEKYSNAHMIIIFPYNNFCEVISGHRLADPTINNKFHSFIHS